MDTDRNIWQAVFKKQDNLVYREIAGEFILVPICGDLADMQKIFMLNPVAEHIWKELDGHRSLSDISGGVTDAFCVNKESAETDALAFIHELLESNLIVEV